MDDLPKDSSPVESFEGPRARLLAALRDTHHITFYTVISVIQATCFGFLALVCFEEGAHYVLFQWLLAACTLVIFVLVWNGFIRGVCDSLLRAETGRRRDAVRSWRRAVFCRLFRRSRCARVVLEYRGIMLDRFPRICERRGQRETQPTENAHIMVFYGRQLRILQVSALFLAVVCAGITRWTDWSDGTLTLLSLPLIAGYVIGDEILWLRLEKFARGAYGPETQ